MNTTRVTALPARPGMIAILGFGPVASLLALVMWYPADPGVFASAPLWMYAVGVLVAWSPLPFSIPAVLLESARDAALPSYRGVGRLVRAVLLVPHMVWASPRRLEFATSLLGFAAASALALALV